MPKAITFSEFLEKAPIIHGGKYDYSNSGLKRKSDKTIAILCPIHGEFRMQPFKHLMGYQCPHCGYESKANFHKYSTEFFIEKCSELHNHKYDYSLTTYTGSRRRVTIICPQHGCFEQLACNHLRGSGCPDCANARKSESGFGAHSQKAIDWIEIVARSRRWRTPVQHALNGGEYVLPGTRIRVDGYHARTNTVLEFHGDTFHGNPRVFEPNSHPNFFQPYKTARTLYLETLARERRIRALGYSLMSIWEYDYDRS